MTTNCFEKRRWCVKLNLKLIYSVSSFKCLVVVVCNVVDCDVADFDVVDCHVVVCNVVVCNVINFDVVGCQIQANTFSNGQ